MKRLLVFLVSASSLAFSQLNNSGQQIYAETPTGQIDGTNATFTLQNLPSLGNSVVLHRNGMRLQLGVDYLVSGKTITFVPTAVPTAGDSLLVDYVIPATGSVYLAPSGGFVAVGTSNPADVPPSGMSTQGLVIANAANPELDFNATGNQTNLKQWQMTVNTGGHFEIANSFSEAWNEVQTLLQINNPANDPLGLGVHTTLNFNAPQITARSPVNASLSLYEYGNGPDAKRWIMQSVGSAFWLRAVSDDQSAADLVMEITRNGFSPNGVWWGTGLKWGGSGVASADLGMGRAAPGVLEINGGTAGSGGGLKIPALRATTGTRFLCIDAQGNVTSSPTACSGT